MRSLSFIFVAVILLLLAIIHNALLFSISNLFNYIPFYHNKRPILTIVHTQFSFYSEILFANKKRAEYKKDTHFKYVDFK